MFNEVSLEFLDHQRVRQLVLNVSTGAPGRMFVKVKNEGVISIIEDGTALRFKDASQIVIRSVEGIDDMVNIKLYKDT